MAALTYLTVQDLLWINLQVTGRVNSFDMPRLEEGTFYQYAYGDSSDLLSQGARFVPGFVKMAPFELGNEATAFVAILAFLSLNEQIVNLKDADGVAWFKKATDKATVAEAIKSIVTPDPHPHHVHNPDIRGAVRGVVDAFPKTIAALATSVAA